MTEFSSQLRAFRGDRPRAWLADYLGFPLRTVEQWEQGLRTPTQGVRGLIEKILQQEKKVS